MTVDLIDVKPRDQIMRVCTTRKPILICSVKLCVEISLRCADLSRVEATIPVCPMNVSQVINTQSSLGSEYRKGRWSSLDVAEEEHCRPDVGFEEDSRESLVEFCIDQLYGVLAHSVAS
ncbi:hypothetical protein JCGZ_22210 [Jatropha curcas]|uniref:Uncharacterized protein n=1 Tax=Jatropha curcas TaxID=180498 RepID=A0A067K2U0_JATCU|nr:hypothetical protein JCGZ_22210 [Jatropha curcas]